MTIIHDAINSKNELSFKILYQSLATQLSIQTTLLVLSAILQSTIIDAQDMAAYLTQAGTEHWSAVVSKNLALPQFMETIDNYIALKFNEPNFIQLCKDSLSVVFTNIDLIPFGSVYDLYLQTIFQIDELSKIGESLQSTTLSTTTKPLPIAQPCTNLSLISKVNPSAFTNMDAPNVLIQHIKDTSALDSLSQSSKSNFLHNLSPFQNKATVFIGFMYILAKLYTI